MKEAVIAGILVGLAILIAAVYYYIQSTKAVTQTAVTSIPAPPPPVINVPGSTVTPTTPTAPTSTTPTGFIASTLIPSLTIPTTGFHQDAAHPNAHYQLADAGASKNAGILIYVPTDGTLVGGSIDTTKQTYHNFDQFSPSGAGSSSGTYVYQGKGVFLKASDNTGTAVDPIIANLPTPATSSVTKGWMAIVVQYVPGPNCTVKDNPTYMAVTFPIWAFPDGQYYPAVNWNTAHSSNGYGMICLTEVDKTLKANNLPSFEVYQFPTAHQPPWPTALADSLVQNPTDYIC